MNINVKHLSILRRFMTDSIAHDLADETSVELAHHTEFRGNAKFAAHYVFYHAVRDNRVEMPRLEDANDIINTLAKIVRE